MKWTSFDYIIEALYSALYKRETGKQFYFTLLKGNESLIAKSTRKQNKSFIEDEMINFSSYFIWAHFSVFDTKLLHRLASLRGQ